MEIGVPDKVPVEGMERKLVFDFKGRFFFQT